MPIYDKNHLIESLPEETVAALTEASERVIRASHALDSAVAIRLVRSNGVRFNVRDFIEATETEIAAKETYAHALINESCRLSDAVVAAKKYLQENE